MRRILLTGCGGQVGFELHRSLAPLAEVIAVDMQDCDLANPDAIRSLVKTVQPDCVVNPAAYTAVDQAESDETTARKVNALAPGILAEEAAGLQVPIVHYSTDYVFDGQKTTPYLEEDTPAPLNVYGQTKLEGEVAVRKANPRHLILRTSWVYGAIGKNFLKTILRLAGKRESLSVVDDQVGAPTPAALLADVTAHMLREVSGAESGTGLYGTYHVAPSGTTSWCGFAKEILAQAATYPYDHILSPESVEAILTEAYPAPAQRPHRSCLNTAKVQERFSLRMPDWREGIGHVLALLMAARERDGG